MTNERISELTGVDIDELIRTAESGEDFAEIAAVEAMAHDIAQREAQDNGQFGVGA